MSEFTEKYINPFTDYGFKKLFGEELNKDLLAGREPYRFNAPTLGSETNSIECPDGSASG